MSGFLQGRRVGVAYPTHLPERLEEGGGPWIQGDQME